MKPQSRALTRTQFFKVAAGALAGMALAGAAANVYALDSVQCNKSGKACRFHMLRNTGLPAPCLPNARASVRIRAGGPTELMRVEVDGLRPNTDYDFFVIQVPKAPFGMAWYQGDIETDAYGHGEQTFEGRFNEETFIVAPNGGNLPQPPTPQVHNNAFPDGVFGQTQQVGPIHTFHLGLWFNSPADAASVGCPSAVTPFNGEHNAGVQVLNTSNFADQQGPLFFIKP
jgi:hypothetical protein